MGRAALCLHVKEGAGSMGSAGWCGAFRHPERRKTAYVKNGLSENMRTESKDLSAAEIWN